MLVASDLPKKNSVYSNVIKLNQLKHDESLIINLPTESNFSLVNFIVITYYISLKFAG